MRRSVALLILLLIVSSAIPALAQNSGSSVEIIDVNIGRYDEDGRVTLVVELRNIEDLDSSLLEISQDGNLISDIETATLDESSVEVGVVLVMDVSGSMEGEPLTSAKAAAADFVRLKRDQDFVALLSFGDAVDVLSRFRNRRIDILDRIETLEAGGETALYDAVIRAAEMYSGSAEGLQRHMIVLTDGADTASTATEQDVLGKLAESGVRVFGIALESPDFDPGPLQGFVTATDGLYLSTAEPAELSELYGQIRRELGNKLVVRFNADQDQPGPVEIAVGYGSLVDATTIEVPGFVREEIVQQTTTTVVFPEAEVFTVESGAPADPATLLWIGVIGAALTVVLLLVLLFGGEKEEDADAFRDRLRAYGRGAGDNVETKTGFLSRIPLLRRFTEQAEEAFRKRGLLGAMNSILEQANIPLKPGEAIAAAALLAVVLGLFAFMFTGNPIVGGVVLLVAALVIIAIVQQVGQREKRRFESQLPDTLILVSTSLRAGLSLQQAVEAVVSEAPDPTAREFGRVIAEARLGRPLVDALNGITERMRSDDWHWAVMAIEIQREVGGNLAEVLQTVADTMLQRNRIRGEIRALTAEGRISAIVLGALPFALFGFLFTTNRSYLTPLLEQTAGWVAIGIGLGLMVLGGLWLRKIVDIEI